MLLAWFYICTQQPLKAVISPVGTSFSKIMSSSLVFCHIEFTKEISLRENINHSSFSAFESVI